MTRENIRAERTLFIELNHKPGRFIKVNFGTSEPIVRDSIDIWKIKLDKLNGGDGFLLGFIKLYDHNPDDAKHILVVDSASGIENKFSYNDIIVNKLIKLDSMISFYLIR